MSTNDKPAILSAERLAEIRKRVDAATPGPWTRKADHRAHFVGALDYLDTPSQVISASTYPGQEGMVFCSAENSAFIAHSREDVPALLAHIDALTAGDVDAETLGERLFYALHPGCDLVWKHYNGESRAPWIAAAVHLFTIGFAAGRIEGDEDRGRLRLIADKQNAEVARLTAELAAERQKHAEAVAEAKAICAKTCEERDAVLSMHLEAKEKARIEGARVEREACAKSLLALSRDPLTSRQMVLVAGILAAVEHIRARGEGGPS